jgi:hypothetical protein
MADPRDLLRTPLGEPGSGRVRYGAAMALFARGEISEAQLDAFRDAAAHDGRDPGLVLADRGLAPVPGPGREAALSGLAAAAETYLAALPLPGAGQVRAGLAARRGPPRAAPAAAHPIADRWLAAALCTLSPPFHGLRDAIAAAAPHLRWQGYDGYPQALIGADFPANHAFATLVGAGSPWETGDFDFGLFLIAPHVFYRDHAHPAPELYAPLTGPHGWRFAPGDRLHLRPAHDPVWNDPLRPHAIKAGAVPFLSLFGWTADVQAPAFVIPAHDWAVLEAMRLPERLPEGLPDGQSANAGA